MCPQPGTFPCPPGTPGAFPGACCKGADPNKPPDGCNVVLNCFHCYLSDASGAPSTTWLRCTDTKWFKQGEGECTKQECPDGESPEEPDPVSMVLVNGRHGNAAKAARVVVGWIVLRHRAMPITCQESDPDPVDYNSN